MTPGRSNAVKKFIARHRDRVKGVLHCFDRVIVRGHLPIAGTGYFMGWLTHKRIGLNLREVPEGWRNFKDAAPEFAERIKRHAQRRPSGRAGPISICRRTRRWKRSPARWPNATASSTVWCACTRRWRSAARFACASGRTVRNSDRTCASAW